MMSIDNHETESGAELISPTHVRHVMRYVQALQYIAPGDVVLDAACGCGYGSSIIATKCRQVHAWDASNEALTYAREHYNVPNVIYENVDLTTGTQTDHRLGTTYQAHTRRGMYDKVVSIETIEHMSMEDGSIQSYLNLMRTVLSDAGLFVVSTPYCEVSGPSPVTKQHLHEFQLGELVELLQRSGFGRVDVTAMPAPGLAGRLGYAMAVARPA